MLINSKFKTPMKSFLLEDVFHNFILKYYNHCKQLLSSKKIYLISACCAFSVIILFIFIIFLPKPPINVITKSRIALNKARHADAEYYTLEMFNAAEQNWRKMIEEWRYQNQQFSFKRDFKKVQYLAGETNRLATLSLHKAIQVRDSLKNVAKFEMILFQEKIKRFKTQYDEIPIEKSLRNRFCKAELLVLESKSAFGRQDYIRAVEKLKLAEPLIGQIGDQVSTMLKTYFANIPHWRRWAQEIIVWSKNQNEVIILIDKMAHVCQVYHEGHLLEEYLIELGSNWIGHKRQKGDNATPEGQYFIRKKIAAGKSKYYKALLIDYPNNNDQENFLIAKKRGELSQDAQIGGSIEIHGEGGKGVNWTQGCIALKNKDMDKVFDLVKIGTPVTIVGSLNGFKNQTY